ncbi:uncharacterized protein ACNS7B_002699 isoform 2-T2 [Menidia menidia]
MRPGALIHQRHTAESRLWFLVILIGASNCYPTKTDHWGGQLHHHDGTSSSNLLEFTANRKPPGLSHENIPGSSSAHPGVMSYMENLYDHGIYDTETKEEAPSKYFPVQPVNRPMGNLFRLGPFVDGFWFGNPYIDRMLLARRHPPGTYVLSSTSLEHGKNHWHDTLNMQDVPATIWQSEGNHFSQTPQQRSRHAGYGFGEVTG